MTEWLWDALDATSVRIKAKITLIWSSTCTKLWPGLHVWSSSTLPLKLCTWEPLLGWNTQLQIDSTLNLLLKDLLVQNVPTGALMKCQKLTNWAWKQAAFAESFCVRGPLPEKSCLSWHAGMQKWMQNVSFKTTGEVQAGVLLQWPGAEARLWGRTGAGQSRGEVPSQLRSPQDPPRPPGGGTAAGVWGQSGGPARWAVTLHHTFVHPVGHS